MKLIIAVISLLAAVAIAAPQAVEVSEAAMTDDQGKIVPYRNTGLAANAGPASNVTKRFSRP